MNPAFKVVIPARYASTRLPGKPLRDMLGKPMIQWVYEAALASRAEQVVVATDDQAIADAVNQFGGECCMTREGHPSGTDRIVEVCETPSWDDDDIVVNLQGDEPLMPPQNLTQVANNLDKSAAHMATLHKSIDEQQAGNPNLVKLVCDHDGQCLYFSRSPIPYDRDGIGVEYCGHIGLYAYRVGFLKTYASMKPCSIEKSEQLEQLRALYHGYRIHTQLALKTPGIGVDTEQDLVEVTQQLMNNNYQ